MIDRHYYVCPDQDKNLALRLKLKPAQLVRQGIDLVLQKHTATDNWLDETRKIRGLLKDDPEIDGRVAKARKSMDRIFDPASQWPHFYSIPVSSLIIHAAIQKRLSFWKP